MKATIATGRTIAQAKARTIAEGRSPGRARRSLAAAVRMLLVCGLLCSVAWIAAPRSALADDAAAARTASESEAKAKETDARDDAASADESPAVPAASEASAAAPVSAQTALQMPVWVPASRGTVATRSGGGTRAASPERLPRLEPLAPKYGVGLTTQAQPSFAWYLSDDTDLRLDFVLTDETSVAPLVEVTLDGPRTAGVHRIDLAEHGIELEPGALYHWSVSLVPDPAHRANDVMARAPVERVSRARSADGDDALAVAAAEARSGLWYDAIETLSEAIDRAPGDTRLRRARAALLDQVELDEVASLERSAAGGR